MEQGKQHTTREDIQIRKKKIKEKLKFKEKRDTFNTTPACYGLINTDPKDLGDAKMKSVDILNTILDICITQLTNTLFYVVNNKYENTELVTTRFTFKHIYLVFLSHKIASCFASLYIHLIL